MQKKFSEFFIELEAHLPGVFGFLIPVVVAGLFAIPLLVVFASPNEHWDDIVFKAFVIVILTFLAMLLLPERKRPQRKSP